MMSYVIHVELLIFTFYNYKIIIKLVIIKYIVGFPDIIYYLKYSLFSHMFMLILVFKIVIVKF